MTTFVQLHYLTTYPPSNPNRDDQGRPKTAMYGGVSRLRLSSQSIKRAARLSPVFQDALSGNLGERTQRIGEVVKEHLLKKGAGEVDAHAIAEKIADVFGKLDAAKNKDGKGPFTAQLAFISPDERVKAMEMAESALGGEALPEVKDLKKLILRTADGAADVAMFGRMLADDPGFNREAAVQVGHAITTHRAESEDDYYTAVDDLKRSSEDAGAGFVGEAGFGSGIYYLYACIDVDLLVANLAGDRELASKAASALAHALATATPSGKQNSFSHHPRACFIRAEIGKQQPRDLSGAFFNAVRGNDLRAESVSALEQTASKIESAYGPSADAVRIMDVEKQEGSLDEVKTFIEQAIRDVEITEDV
ncbi:MAG: type I-E CRISPR-associated protein Cas7/Cse4/CasC [Gammaproteobacteria bacterium]|nr:MAG: type I-E CRISPR-associated protein Cas7/Cse4/CasC [Gammaproteobacteria bacterium]